MSGPARAELHCGPALVVAGCSHTPADRSPEAIWTVIEDPFAMPRWWPGVERIEGVEEDRFTQVLQTKRRRAVRMDFRVLVSRRRRGAAARRRVTARGSRR